MLTWGVLGAWKVLGAWRLGGVGCTERLEYWGSVK